MLVVCRPSSRTVVNRSLRDASYREGIRMHVATLRRLQGKMTEVKERLMQRLMRFLCFRTI